MRICDSINGMCPCTSADAALVGNVYDWDNIELDCLGGNIAPGSVQLVITLDYR